MTVFRTYTQDLSEPWNPQWIREIKTHARAVCVRVRGLNALEQTRLRCDSDDRSITNFEAQAKRVVRSNPRARGGRSPTMAFVILRWDVIHDGQSPFRIWSTSARQMYRGPVLDRLEPLADLLGHHIRYLAGATALPMVLAGEDFSCRWLLRTRFKPEFYILDQPCVTYSQAREEFADLLTRPGIVRNSDFPAMRFGPPCFPYRPKELIASHLPVRGRIGWWLANDLHTIEPIARTIHAAPEWTTSSFDP